MVIMMWLVHKQEKFLMYHKANTGSMHLPI